MQKTCKSEKCKRKFDKTSHSDLCPACTDAYKSGENQSTKRIGHQQRQQTARAQAQDSLRDINTIEMASPAPPEPTPSNQVPPTGQPNMNPFMMYQNMMYQNMYPNQGMFPPMFPTNLTNYPPPAESGTPSQTPAAKPTPTPKVPSQPQAPPPPVANISNFPQLNSAPTPSASLPDIDVNNMVNTFKSMQSGSATVNTNDALKDIYGMMIHMLSKSAENDEVKKTVVQCVSRLDSIEAKVGTSDDPSIPLSLAVRFLPLPNPGQTDLQLVKAALREVHAQGVDVERDVIKAVRLGETTDGRLGTVLAEMRNQETKAQNMKAKKCLESHPDQGLQKLIITNAQTKSEIKMNIALNQMLKKIPGEHDSYVAGNGHIMSKNNQNGPTRGRAPPPQRRTAPQQAQRQQAPNSNFPNPGFFPPPCGYFPGMPQPQGNGPANMPHMPMFGAPYNPFMHYQPPQPNPAPPSTPVLPTAQASTAQVQADAGQEQL